MCGIFGWIPADGAATRQADVLVRRLIEALKHRGPNDDGAIAYDRAGNCHREPGAFSGIPLALLLGQTRLSIIDLSSAGHQPMSSADGRYTIVFNGEIYNYIELREELCREGAVFATHTDTEVLLQWVIRNGKDGLGRLTGMFAFAVYDRQERTLFCARDPFGIKPFFYTQNCDGFCFASELPALFQFPSVRRRVSPQAAYVYLQYGLYDIGDATFLQDVYHLPAGHCLTLRLDAIHGAQAECYWRPAVEKTSEDSFADAAARVREIFLENIRLHLRSDVPLGIALSGGIDSSAVACAVRHLEPEAEIHTFSFVARGSDVSEEEWIDKVAAHARVIPHKVFLEPGEMLRDLDDMVRNQGEPFGSTSIYAQRRVFQLARECGVAVTLDGQGADELFGGYQGYPGQRLATMVLRGDFAGAFRFLKSTGAWPGRSVKESLIRLVRELTPDALVGLGQRVCGRNPLPDWLDGARLREEKVCLRLGSRRDQMYRCPERLRRTLAYQLTWEGLPLLLRHADRNSMAFSIESRVPFLTRELAEYSLSLPEEYLVDRGGCTKAVFRAAMRGIVPDEVLDRRDKIGFATPEKQWMELLAGWIDDTLSHVEEAPYLHLPALRREWGRIQAGERPFDFRVWRWLNYLRWVDVFQIGD